MMNRISFWLAYKNKETTKMLYDESTGYGLTFDGYDIIRDKVRYHPSRFGVSTGFGWFKSRKEFEDEWNHFKETRQYREF